MKKRRTAAPKTTPMLSYLIDLHENQPKLFINDNHKQYLFHMQSYHMALEGQIKNKIKKTAA